MLAALIAVLVAAAPTGFRLDPSANQRVEYHVTHPFHDVTGVAQRLQGQARQLPDGAIEAEIRLPFSAFVTGNQNRDANARAAVGVAQHPDIVVKAVVRSGTPSSYPATLRAVADANVTLRGVSLPERVPLTITWVSPDRARVTGGFQISLDAFHVKRPELLFVPVADAVHVDFDLTWAAEAVGLAPTAPVQNVDQPSTRPTWSSVNPRRP